MEKITLTDEVQQDEPVAYMVFCCNDDAHDYKVFCDKIEAITFAEYQVDEAGVPEWKVYPLWASDGEPVSYLRL